MSKQLAGKRGLIMGVANDRSIAWGIAKAMADAGAELAFTYQGEAFGKRLEPLAASVGSDFMVDVDVTDDASLDAAFEALGARWPTIDFVVHAIAFSDKSELTGRFLNTSRANFKHSMDISAYSFIEVARRAHPMMVDNGGTLDTEELKEGLKLLVDASRRNLGDMAELERVARIKRKAACALVREVAAQEQERNEKLQAEEEARKRAEEERVAVEQAKIMAAAKARAEVEAKKKAEKAALLASMGRAAVKL